MRVELVARRLVVYDVPRMTDANRNPSLWVALVAGLAIVAVAEGAYIGRMHWQNAMLEGPVLSKSVVRFRLPWQWNGSNALLQSRATDEKGNVQPTRKAYKEAMAVDSRFHNNTIVTWSVDADGSIKNVFA